jgi:cytoskeletal protein CcmA (bactofilin family)
MFGSSKNEKSNSNNNSTSSSSNVTNSIVEGTYFKGDIQANNDIRIDGTVEGKLSCKGRVILGSQGKFEGSIQCQNAIIEGAFTGDIVINELLTVKESAVINGDIKTDKLFVHTGAVFNVTCSMSGQKLKPIVNKEATSKLG